MFSIEQGDILKVENIKYPVLVVSKNFFNRTEQAIVCPIIQDEPDDPLHIPFKAKKLSGTVLCEEMKLMDFRYRGFSLLDRIDYSDIINITDAIQSIFDY